MRCIKLICCILMVLQAVHAKSQEKVFSETEKMAAVEQRIEWLAENLGDEQPDLTTLFDRLMYYIDHPLNLNSATKTDLEELFLLNPIQVDELLLHIARNGKLISIYELQGLPSWDLMAITNVLPFVRVDNLPVPHLSFSQMLKAGNNELYQRWGKVLEKQKGYRPDPATGVPNYLGTNDRLYTRYRFKSGSNISAGITGEKDPGEQFFKGSQRKGYDFYSAHLYVKDLGMVKHAVVGDYLVAFGQGLTMGTGLAFGKTASCLNVKKQAFKIKPYNSVTESNFFRGAATTVRFRHIDLTLFASSRRNDANTAITDTSNYLQDNGIIISSFQTTGLHTTPAELSDKNSIRENIGGANLSYSRRTFEVGATFYAVHYNGFLQKDLKPYNQFDFTGNTNAVGGLNYSWLVRNFHFFGETAMSRNHALGTINGVLASLDPKLGLVIMQRYYAKDFQNLYANALAEGTRPVNENGLYYGLEYKPSSKWNVNAYADMFASRWLRYQVNQPSKGNEFLVQITFKPNKQTEMYFRYRERNKEKNTDLAGVPIEYTVNVNQRNYRFNLTHQINKNISLRTRFEQVVIHREDAPPNPGFIAFQDLIFKPRNSHFSFNLRYAVFNTQDYDSRLYAYENDILYYYSIPAYTYKGSRTYLNVHYALGTHTEIWFKIGRWLYDDRTTIGSGNETINGNSKTDFRLQVRFVF